MAFQFKVKINELKRETDTPRSFLFANNVTQNNLIMIDFALPELCTYLIELHLESKAVNIYDLIKLLDKRNPLNFDFSQKQPFYEYKIKNLLLEIANGMQPDKVWKGYSIFTEQLLTYLKDDLSFNQSDSTISDVKNILLRNTSITTLYSSNDCDCNILYNITLIFNIEHPKKANNKYFILI